MAMSGGQAVVHATPPDPEVKRVVVFEAVQLNWSNAGGGSGAGKASPLNS